MGTTPGDLSGLLGVLAVARKLGVSFKTLKRMIALKQFPQGVLVSRRAYWTQQQVDDYLAKHFGK
jgi:predicted DNA-binding transcriptional regulator AlpA